MKNAILNTLDYSRDLIISPDIDGLTSARLLEDFNGSRVVGTYDKNVMTLMDGIDPKQCLFVDCDMNRAEYVSIGNHMRLMEDNIASESFNPNVYYQVNKYSDKYPFATAFLISFATGVPTSHETKLSMAYADSTYKNLVSYSDNMNKWHSRMNHEALDFVFELSDDNVIELLYLEEDYPSQGFVSKRLGQKNYLKAMSAILDIELTEYFKFVPGKIDKNTLIRYNKDIISYAEIYGGEYAVTYDQEM